VADLWIAVAGVVTRTERLTLRPLVTPVSRQRAGNLVCETVTLNRLSRGRLVLAEGLEVNSGGERLRRHRQQLASLLDEPPKRTGWATPAQLAGWPGGRLTIVRDELDRRGHPNQRTRWPGNVHPSDASPILAVTSRCHAVKAACQQPR
jgi:hypothetical protein